MFVKGFSKNEQRAGWVVPRHGVAGGLKAWCLWRGPKFRGMESVLFRPMAGMGARISVLLPALILALPVQAEPIAWEASLSSEYSDNIRRVRDKDSDIVYQASLAARYHNQEGRFDHSFDGQIGLESYHEGTYDDDFTLNLGWRGLVHLLPGRFSWRFQDDLSETRRISSRPFTPDNRERRNFFSTGPAFQYPLTRRDLLGLSAEYARTDYEHSSETDTYRYGANLGWTHLFPNRLESNLGLGVQKVFLRRDQELRHESLSLALSRGHDQFNWRLMGGYAETEADQFGRESSYDGMEWEVLFNYQLSSNSDLKLFASQQLTDTSSEFAVLIFDLPFTLSIQQVVRLTLYEVGYTNRFTARNRFTASLSRHHEEFEETGDTEESNMAAFRLEQDFSPRVSGYLYGAFEYRRYGNLDREDNEGELGLGLRYRPYRNLSIEASSGYRRQNSDDRSFDYDEIRLGVRIVYHPSTLFSTWDEGEY